jgi:hypothetical protein
VWGLGMGCYERAGFQIGFGEDGLLAGKPPPHQQALHLQDFDYLVVHSLFLKTDAEQGEILEHLASMKLKNIAQDLPSIGGDTKIIIKISISLPTLFPCVS